MLKVSKTPGPTAYSRTKMVQLDKVCLRKEKNSMTGPKWPGIQFTLKRLQESTRQSWLTIFS